MKEMMSFRRRSLFVAVVLCLWPVLAFSQFVSPATSTSTNPLHYDGAIGIGTGATSIGSSPFLAPLTVQGTNGFLFTMYQGGDTTKRFEMGMVGGASPYLQIGYNGYSRMQIHDDGRAEFYVDGPSRDIFSFRANTGGPGDTFLWSISANGTEFYIHNNTLLGGAAPFVISQKATSPGYVGILTDPLASFHVNGNARFGSGGNNASAYKDVVLFSDTPAQINNVNYDQINSIMPSDLPPANSNKKTALRLKNNVGASNNVNQIDLIVDGNIAAKYQDVAEWVPATAQLPAGSVVSIDADQSNVVRPSAGEYETSVAGVVSALPGVILGEGGANKLMIATTGRVKVRVDASSRPIARGDLLVTSGKPGVAMASVPVDLGGVRVHRPGTVIGKALEPLAGGQGEILVLLSLQ